MHGTSGCLWIARGGEAAAWCCELASTRRNYTGPLTEANLEACVCHAAGKVVEFALSCQTMAVKIYGYGVIWTIIVSADGMVFLSVFHRITHVIGGC